MIEKIRSDYQNININSIQLGEREGMSWFEIHYCLTKELGPHDHFLRNHKLRVYRHKLALHNYFSKIQLQSGSNKQPRIYLAYQQIQLTSKQLQELWAPVNSNIVRSVGDPTCILNGDYEIKGNEQFVVITDPPEPALLYQWGMMIPVPCPEKFPYHPRRWLTLYNLEPIIQEHPKELRQKRTWELIRYHLEQRYGFHADPIQKKANLTCSHLEGVLWENWVKYRHSNGKLLLNSMFLQEQDLLTVYDRIVLIRKPSPKGFLPYKPVDFFALEARFESEEAALRAITSGQCNTTKLNVRGNLPIGAKIHASLAHTDKMIRPDQTKCERCSCCGSKWHFAEFCQMHRMDAQIQKGRLITQLPTGIPKLFFKAIAPENRNNLLEQGYKLYFDPDEQVSQEERTLYISTKNNGSDQSIQEEFNESCNNELINERLDILELETLSERVPEEPEHCFVIFFEKAGVPICNQNFQWLPARPRSTLCKFQIQGYTNIIEIFLHILKTALLKGHKTFTVVLKDWIPREYQRETWYRTFIQEGDRNSNWEIVVPAPVLSPFIINQNSGLKEGPSGVVITRWTYDAAISLYGLLNRENHNHHPVEPLERLALEKAQMIQLLEWEMSKIRRKKNWRILLV